MISSTGEGRGQGVLQGSADAAPLDINLSDVDLSNPGLFASASGLLVLRRLQSEDPVHWNRTPGGGGFWVLTRYEDAVQVFRRRDAFTSEHGIQVGQAEAFDMPAAGKMMVLADGPSHKRLKALFGQGLIPAALTSIQSYVSSLARESVQQVMRRGSGDAVSDISSRISFAALAQLLGIPAADRAALREATDASFGGDASTLDSATAGEANAQLFALLASRLTRSESGAFVGQLAEAAREGRMSTEELLLNVHLLLAGGLETTRHALNGAVLAVIEHPAQFERVHADRSLLGSSVEEILRWYSPSLNVMRTARSDVVIGSQLVRAGERVTMWNPIINRDPRAFPEPDCFDVRRAPNRHLTFAAGRHFCLGSWLAKLQVASLVEALIDTQHAAQKRFALQGEPPRVRSTRAWGYSSIPVVARWDA